MDPPPIPAAAPPSIQPNHPDSIESSSPRSRNAEQWNNEEPLPAVPGAKLRLMCSYGGHIMPRPHDKSLCYVGGDTRIVVVDRHSSLKELCFRLSKTILNGRPFTLKYQLPNEDLDNLITVTTDEDLENMIEEYDRAATKPSPSRLRVFLFFDKPESSVSMGSLLLDDAKSETWFVDALNNSGILSRGVSDSAAGDSFVNLDGVPNSGSSNNLEAQGERGTESKTEYLNQNENNNRVKSFAEVVQSTPGSPMLENGTSSSSSSPSMANLPPIRVRVVDENGSSRLQQENRIMEEQFAQMSIGVKGDNEGYVVSASGVAMPVNVTIGGSDNNNNNNRIVSDDERSEPAGFRKPPLPLQLVQPRASGGVSLPSPDSVTSDSSFASTNSFSKTVYYQEPVAQQPHNALPIAKSEITDQVPTIQREQQIQLDQNQQQIQQQQFVQTHYIHHPPTATGPVPVSSYYQVYPPPPPPSQQQQPPLHHPIYVMPVGPTQPYTIPLQQSAVAPPTYKDGTPPIYPTKTVPEVTPQNVYKVPSNPTLVQVQQQQQQQYHVGLPQLIHHPPPQSIAIAAAASSAAPTPNYGYDQAYYTQQQTTTPLIPPQYQSMTPAVAAAALSDATKQFLPSDNNNSNVQQPNRTSPQLV